MGDEKPKFDWDHLREFFDSWYPRVADQQQVRRNPDLALLDLHDRGEQARSFLGECIGELDARLKALEAGGSRERGMLLAYKEGQESAAKELFELRVSVAHFVEYMRTEQPGNKFAMNKLRELGLIEKKEG